MNKEDLKKLGKILNKFKEIKKQNPEKSDKSSMMESVSIIKDQDK